jgi:hypothetical protein
MTNLKYIAAVLALVGAVGSAQAGSEVNKDQIQFMDDSSLKNIKGAFIDGNKVKKSLCKNKYFASKLKKQMGC